MENLIINEENKINSDDEEFEEFPIENNKIEKADIIKVKNLEEFVG